MVTRTAIAGGNSSCSMKDLSEYTTKLNRSTLNRCREKSNGKANYNIIDRTVAVLLILELYVVCLVVGDIKGPASTAMTMWSVSQVKGVAIRNAISTYSSYDLEYYQSMFSWFIPTNTVIYSRRLFTGMS